MFPYYLSLASSFDQFWHFGTFIIIRLCKHVDNKNRVDGFVVNILDAISKVLTEMTSKLMEIEAFYSTKENWDSCHYLGGLKDDKIYPRKNLVDSLLCKCSLDTSKQLLRLALAENLMIKRNLDELNENIRFIQTSSLQRMAQLCSRKSRIIPFGRLRAWTSDAMKSGSRGPKSSVSYFAAAKCARLRRRLSRLFALAQAAHVLRRRATCLEHPAVTALQQDLMRIRLALTLHLKKTHSQVPDLVAPLACTNPGGLLDRTVSRGVPECIHSRLESLADAMAELIVSLSQESAGLGRILTDDTQVLTRPEEVRDLMRHSLVSFCNFYVTSVAVELSPVKEDNILSQFTNFEDVDDISPSDTECMMDAFDIFDTFIESNAAAFSQPRTPESLEEGEVTRNEEESSFFSMNNDVCSPAPEVDFVAHPSQALLDSSTNFANSTEEHVPLEENNTQHIKPHKEPLLPLPFSADVVSSEPQSATEAPVVVMEKATPLTQVLEQEEGEITDDENTHNEPMEGESNAPAVSVS